MRNVQTSCLALAAPLLIAVGGGSSEARAAPALSSPPIPASCDATAAIRNAYRMGETAGRQLVNQAWARVNDCDRIDYFLDVLQDNVNRLTVPSNASVSTICRYTGTVDGVYEMLDTLYGTCSDQCFLDGAFAGELSGKVYCELSIALGGLTEADEFLRGPVQVCGLNFEFGCDSAFIHTTTTYNNSDGVCYQYTDGQFEEVWDQARNNQCAYNPIPPPPHPSELADVPR